MTKKEGETSPSDTPETMLSGSVESKSGESTATKTTASGKRASKKIPTMRRLLDLFLLAVVMCVVGFSGYLWWENRDPAEDEVVSQSAPGTGQESLDAALVAQLTTLTREVDALNQKNALLEASLTALASSTASEISGLAERTNSPQIVQRIDWQLAEAEYLSRLASQRIAFEDRPDAAIALLESADRILMDAGVPEVREARRLIALDLSRLKTVPLVDREGIYLRLGALMTEFAQLEPNSEAGNWVESDQDSSDEPNWFVRQWDRFVSKIKSYIVVRREADDSVPMMEFRDELVFQANLVLLIRQAQLALFQMQPDVYQRSLGELRDALQAYSPDNQTARALDQQIEELASERIEVALPDLVASSRAIRQAIEQINQNSPLDSQTQGVNP